MGRLFKKIINGRLECANCKRMLPILEFTRSKQYKSGYKPYCRLCEQFLNRKNRWKETMRFKELGEWLKLQKGECIYCRITPKQLQNEYHIFFGQYPKLTIDRKDNSKGYIKNNICLACSRCNRIKSDIFTFNEMKIIGKMLKAKQKKPPSKLRIGGTKEVVLF